MARAVDTERAGSLPLKAQILLIVNADDLGISQAINDDIFALMDAGLVT